MTEHRPYDFEEIRQRALTGPRVTSLLGSFERIAAGITQVPNHPINAAPEFLRQNKEYVRHHSIFQKNLGTFYKHGCASIPFLIEENIRVDVALKQLATMRIQNAGVPLSYYETSSADGTRARTLAEYTDGYIRTLTDSPNNANRTQFQNMLQHSYSFFHLGPFVDVTPEFLARYSPYPMFANKFDVIWENTTFQMYNSNRDEQIAYIKRVLKKNGLMLFLEKMSHGDSERYRQAERIKDTEFKSKYFSINAVTEKRTEILWQMELGQVTLTQFIEAARHHFVAGWLIWNSGNFYEIAASDSMATLESFLSFLPKPYVPEEFIYERPMVRRLW